jgi:lysophospholipase L1-like esterase
MRAPSRCLAVLGILFCCSAGAAQDRPLPKVVLIGDSIRLGYAPFVAKLLAGKATVVSPKPNGEDSANVLKNLDEWVIKEKPDVVHLNAGLHDLKLTGTKYQVPIADYQNNLRAILEAIRTKTSAKVIFATSTPIIDTLHAQRKAGFDRVESDVQRYNVAALAIMKEAGVPTSDLHRLVEDAGKERVMAGDGTHYSDAGYEMLAGAVTKSILALLPH